MRVPQPAQNSASGGIARPHLEQKDADSMSVMGPGALALWSFCQIAAQNVVFDSFHPAVPEPHLGYCANGRAGLHYVTLNGPRVSVSPF